MPQGGPQIQPSLAENPAAAETWPRGKKWTRYLHRNGFQVGLIATVAWISSYLHFTSFGVYEDDWFYVAFPHFIGVKRWLAGSLLDVLFRLKAQGRPLQMILGYLFSAFGALTQSLAVDYLIAYLLSFVSAWLLYEVLRRKFSRLVATLASLLFTLTPLDTLHQFLNGEYSWGPAFILVFLGMLLYIRGKRGTAYVVAALSLFAYESVFFIFLGAPLLKRGPVFKGRRTEWTLHGSAITALVACYFLIRMLVAESRASGLPHGLQLVWSAAYSCFFYTAASFLTYAHAALRAGEAGLEAWVYAVPLFVLLLWALQTSTQKGHAMSKQSNIKWLLKSIAISLIFIAAGYAVSYFFYQSSPRTYMADRDTRVSVAASFGSSLLFAVVLSGALRLARNRAAKLVVSLCGSAFLCMLFLYSFVLQDEYIADWADQREQIRQVVTLTPDLGKDSTIILSLRSPQDSAAVTGHRRAIGGEKFMFEQEFPWLCSPFGGNEWPRLLIMFTDGWPQHLQKDTDGLLTWRDPVFDGRWQPATGRLRPGRVIVLQEKQPGVIVRNSDPINVDGVQIVQQAPSSSVIVAGLWGTLSDNYMARQFFPAYVRKAVTSSGPSTPQLLSPPSGSVLTSSPLVLTWTSVPGAVDYWIDVGTGYGKGDIWANFSGGKTSVSVDLAGHLTGETIHVQIYAAPRDYHLVPGSGSKFTYSTAAPTSKGKL